MFGRRSPTTRLTLFPIAVQGAQAPQEIVRAIANANRLAKKLGIQALIVGRGGGSIEDLQAFNEESVARAIASSELPVCSAVGHETDFTIADFVADLRAPTPSAAAELLSQNQEDLLQSLNAARARLLALIQARLQASSKNLAWLVRSLKRPDRLLAEQSQHLDRLELQLARAWRMRTQRSHSRVALLDQRLQAQSPNQRLTRVEQQLNDRKHRLMRAIKTLIATKSANLGQLTRSLDTVSPLATLARGYSISYDANGALLRSADQAQTGAKLSTQVADGLIISTIDTIEKESR